MQTKIVLILFSICNCFAVKHKCHHSLSKKNIAQGSHNEPLDYYLYTYVNTTTDIHYSPGCYHVMDQPSCLIQNND